MEGRIEERIRITQGQKALRVRGELAAGKADKVSGERYTRV
jgi:hypothetical protein